MLFLLRSCCFASKIVALCLLFLGMQNFALGQGKGTKRWDFGIASLNILDYGFAGGDTYIGLPVLKGIGKAHERKVIKFFPLQASYTRYFSNRFAYFFKANAEVVKTQYRDKTYGITKNLYTSFGLWGGVEFNYLRRRNFNMDFRFGIGPQLFYQYQKTEKEKPPYEHYSDIINLFDVYKYNILVPFIALEIQPLNMRFGNNKAVYLNLSLGTTGLIQMGYSKRF